MHHFSKKDRDVIFKYFNSILREGGMIFVIGRAGFDYMPFN